jgi:hypothetical protein
MCRGEIPLDRGWEWSIGTWHPVPVPDAWQHYPGGWNHRGSARYRIELPPAGDRPRWLRFDGVQYRCRIRYLGKVIGRHEGGWDPFWIPLPAGDPGGLLEVDVESIGPRLPLEETTSGFLPDCGLLPCGLWRGVTLVETGAAVVENVLLRWVPSRRTLKLKPLGAAPVRAALFDAKGEEVARTETLELNVPSPRLWHPEDPYRYTLRVTARDEEGRPDLWEKKVGLRHVKVNRNRIELNGEPLMLRGALHWGYDPETIVPLADEARLRREMEILQRSGFNLVKHCLYVPDDRYFELGDELGMLQWLELPMWLPSGSEAFARRVTREYSRITAAFQHHPSLVIYSLGCELNDRVKPSLLKKLHTRVKRRAPGALLCDNSGTGACYGGHETGLSDFLDVHFYAEPVHLDALVERFATAKPLVFGEFCDCDVFRNLKKIRGGLDQRACWWLEKDPRINPLVRGTRVQPEPGCLFQEERLAGCGLGGQEERIEKASLRHAAAHRKLTIETVRSHTATAGYVVTGMRDTPISTSGLFNDLHEPRFEMQEINGAEILLLRPPPRRAWIRGGDRTAGYDLFHHPSGGLFQARVPGGRVCWTLGGDSGFCEDEDLRIPLPVVERSTTLTLALTRDGLKNRWPLFIHPPSSLQAVHLHDPHGELSLFTGLEGGEDAAVWVTSDLDEAVKRHLDAGGHAILVQAGFRPLQARGLPFWREACHLVGDHPLGRRFPFSDGGGEELLALTTDRFFAAAGQFRPVLSRLDMRDFTLTHSLVEIERYPGRLLATTLSLAGGPGRLPSGLKNNRAGAALLSAMIGALEDCADIPGGYSS